MKWIKKIVKWCWSKTIGLFKYLWHELKNWHTLLLFGIVCAIVGIEVWLPLVIGFITGNAWWFGIAATCEAFWLAPFTPFLPLCIGITFAIKSIHKKLKFRRNVKWLL